MDPSCLFKLNIQGEMPDQSQACLPKFCKTFPVTPYLLSYPFKITAHKKTVL